MVKRRVVAARKVQPAAPAPQAKLQRRKVELDEIEELEDEVEDEDEDEEEEEEVAPRRVSRRVVEDDISDEDEDEEGEDEVKPVKRGAAAPAPTPAKAKPAAAPAPAAVIKPVQQTVQDNFLTDMLTALEDGKALVITRIADNKWQVTTSQPVVASKGMSNADAWVEMANPDYLRWSEEWKTKSFEEKKKHAKKLGVKWETHENPRIEVIRITQAVREAEGIEKYKPEYRSRSARAALYK